MKPLRDVMMIPLNVEMMKRPYEERVSAGRKLLLEAWVEINKSNPDMLKVAEKCSDVDSMGFTSQAVIRAMRDIVKKD